MGCLYRTSEARDSDKDAGGPHRLSGDLMDMPDTGLGPRLDDATAKETNGCLCLLSLCQSTELSIAEAVCI